MFLFPEISEMQDVYVHLGVLLTLVGRFVKVNSFTGVDKIYELSYF